MPLNYLRDGEIMKRNQPTWAGGRQYLWTEINRLGMPLYAVIEIDGDQARVMHTFVSQERAVTTLLQLLKVKSGDDGFIQWLNNRNRE